MTVCTADYFQHYIPIFVWSALKSFEDTGIIIYLRGELDELTKEAFKVMHGGVGNSDTKAAATISFHENIKIIQYYKTDYPYLPSTTNALRFTTDPIMVDEVLITDIDFFFTKMPMDVFFFYRGLMDNHVYVGHHGPYKKPHRPEICDSWTGDYERIGGGFVVLYPDWWEKTKEEREEWDYILKVGNWGHFREADEVMLFRIIRDSGLPIAPKIPFPRFLRHLHLGDFKESMKTRYEDHSKMRALLDGRCVNKFIDALSDETFQKILDVVCKDPQIYDIIKRTTDYCYKRKAKEV